MSVPQIPPRPTRSQQQPSISGMEIPQIPPRPQRRTSERSQSPNRENFPRSPFNEPPTSMTHSNRSGGLYSHSQNASSSSLPPRPPSVSLPSVGQEGSEYADINYANADAATEGEHNQNEPQEMRNVGGDLPLHAPKPSFASSTAKRRVSTVTRTDSTQAAAAGIGKATTPTLYADDHNPQDRNLKARVSFRTGSSASTERPDSAQLEDEHGIPEIGQRVPMYPDAGDVQAPSPSPFQQIFPAGIGFHNAGTAKPGRHHRRTPSGREQLPPGSYGMHGHGMQSTDQFERAWYEKHPEALQKEEHGEYGPGIGGGRGEWALSSDDLNKLVRETAKTTPNTPGLPNEQIGYIASEEYASRLNTPHSATFKMAHSNSSQPHVESPLRKSSFPIDTEPSQGLHKTKSHDPSARWHENALESETEDDEIRIPPPTVRKNKIHGNGYDPPTEDLGPQGGNTEAEGGFIEERGYGVPILASDEVDKTPGAEYLQPAVSPAQERRGSSYYSGVDSDAQYQSGFKFGSRSGSASNSRPTSRPGSAYGLAPLSRFSTHDEDRENMHTPLEDVDEYEPLFPDEDHEQPRKPMSVAERLKLRDQMKRFPSQDIWEDTPNSLQLHATVETPETQSDQSDPKLKATSAVFETPEQESARKGEITEAEKAELMPREERLAKSHFEPHLRDEMHRPGMKQRFPSRDIWEDTPDSAILETTVGETPDNDPRSPPDEGLEAGAVVHTSGRPSEGIILGEQPRDNATAGAAAIEPPSIPPRPSKSKSSSPAGDLGTQPLPSVPARPPRKLHQVPPADAQVPVLPSVLSKAVSPTESKQSSPTDARKGPLLPERPKPQMPARPARPIGRESSETVPLSKMTSASSAGSDVSLEKGLASPPFAPKPKPAVPARPAGSKIANIKAGFLSDLDSRLKLGPQAPKPQEKAEPEQEVEKAPLADARKARAKGPARRKPATASDASGVSATTGDSKSNWQIQQPWTVWQTDDTGAVNVTNAVSNIPITEPMPKAEALNTAPAPVSAVSETADDASDVADMQQAKLAVEESLQAIEPLAKEKVDVPEDTDPAAPKIEEEGNVLRFESGEPVASSSSPVVSPLIADVQGQTGEKDLTVNLASDKEEMVTTVASGEAQGEGDALVRE